MTEKKYRLRKLLYPNGVEREGNVTIESAGSLKDWLIVTYKADDRIPPNQISRFREALHEKLGEKVLVVPDSIEFAIFEEVESD